MTELIPYEQIDDGFERTKFLVKSLFETSKIACEKKHYHVSIGLSILAYEEIFKMQMFFMALQDKTGIDSERWKLITKGDRAKGKSPHLIKYEQSYLSRKEFIKKRGFDDHLKAEQIIKKMNRDWRYYTFDEKTRIDPEALERLGAFNKIKNECFYINWENDDWHIFTKTAKEERRALAELLLWIVEFHYCTTVLDKNNPTINSDENSASFQKYIHDPLFKRQSELEKMLNNPKFMKTRVLATKLIDRYRSTNVSNGNTMKHVS